MKNSKPCLLTALCLVAGCTLPQPEQGGANVNDRSAGGEEGELLLTGMMTLSPDGKHALMQRNVSAVLVDFDAQTTQELPFQPQRFVFSKAKNVGYAVRADGALVAFDLGSVAELWSFQPPSASISLLRVADGDAAILLGEATNVHVIDASTGTERGNVTMTSVATHATFLPKHGSAVLVGTTQWHEHQPKTALVSVDLQTLAISSIEIPNCDSRLVALPDETRALLSPTFCQEDKSTNPNGVWTNPDPVSVIDIGKDGLAFVRNLPGFGPVAMSADGARAVAYLDTERMDPSMFDDPNQVPKAGADRYHLMVIDPKTQQFTLDPIGNALPRFAITPDGKGMLVDSSVMFTRVSAKADVKADLKIGKDGLQVSGSAQIGVFSETAPFGYFDLDARHFTPFAGPAASLDRFVQTNDGRVFTLRTRSDGLGGDLFEIDLAAKTTIDMGTMLRDIGILPDKATLVLRIRQPALQEGGMAYTREDYCLSLDGITCGLTIHYQDSTGTPVKTCDYHDC